MPVKIFCCAAQEDKALVDKLRSHLMPLQHEGIIEVRYDRDTSPGGDWKQEIASQMDVAEIILLLISPDFMASDYGYHTEMIRALGRREKEGTTVIPIILRPVDWQNSPFAHLKVLPTNDTPVTGHSEGLDQALSEVTEEIRTVIKQLSHRPLAYLDRAIQHFLPPPGTEDVLRNPDQIYLPLTCSAAPRSQGDKSEDAISYIDRILKERQVALIVGDYGTGKSFLAQKIFLEKAKAYRTGSEQAPRLPVLLPLKQLAGRGRDLVLTEIIEHLQKLHFFAESNRQPKEMRSEIEAKLRAGAFLCILDGFDEIPLISVHLNPLEELNTLITCLAIGDNRIIITTRPGILPGVFAPDFLKDIVGSGIGFLQPWRGKENWHHYILECIRLGVDVEGDNLDFEQWMLFEQWVLKELRELTTTPLYCHMLVETRRDIMGTTDINLAKLYQMYTERYFERVSSRSPLSIMFKNDLSKEIEYKKDCLAATAVGMVKKNNLRLTKEEINWILQRDAQKYSDQLLLAFTEKDIVMYSLFVLDPGNMYSFSHKSFYEFFAALKIYQELSEKSRFVTLDDVLLTNEIVTFLAGMLAFMPAFKEELAEAFRKQRPLEDFGIRYRQNRNLPESKRILLRNLALIQLELAARLEGVNLAGLNFNGYRFSSREHSRELIGVEMNRCEMEGAVLERADLRGSRLCSARLNRSILDGADLRGVDLKGAFLQDISCDGTRFYGAKFDLITCKKQDSARILAAIYRERSHHFDEVQDEGWLKDTEITLNRRTV